MDLLEVGCGYVDWIGLAQDRDRWRTLVSAVMNLRVAGETELGTQVKTGSLAGPTHTLNNPQVECTGVLLCVIRE